MSRRTQSFLTMLSEDNLGTEAKDFIESLKTYDFHLLDPTFNSRIRFVNSSKQLGELIKDSSFELGDIPKIPLNHLNFDNPQLNQFIELGLKRSSTRKFSTDGLSFDTLSALLQAAYFNKNNVQVPEGLISAEQQQTLKWKNIASGGGVYTVELYYINFKTDGLPSGAYHYNLQEKTLEQVSVIQNEADLNEVRKGFFADKGSVIDFENASGAFVLAGIINRASFKYGNRAIGFAYIDAGAIINNIYQLASVLNYGCCGNGGYIDDILKKYLGLRTNYQVILGTVIIGSL
jgi:SagB-type dehydrogenase family enzyme